MKPGQNAPATQITGGETPWRTLVYGLGQRDRLAGASLGRLPTAWEKIRMMAIIATAGFGATLLPHDLPGFWYWTSLVTILVVAAGGALLSSNISFRRDAAKLPIPQGAVTLDAYADRVVERSNLGDRQVLVERVSMVVATDGHLFIREGKLPVIIPERAFASRADLDGFAQWIEAAEEPASP
jgi:hypothetical protein